MKNTLLYKVLIHLKQNVLRSMVYKATKLQKQNTVQLLPFDEDNTYLYQLDESYIDRERRPRSIFFHRAIKTCIDRYMSYLFYYNIILFKSCDLYRLDTIDILRTKIVMSLNFYIY
jgi:hypothetical protein